MKNFLDMSMEEQIAEAARRDDRKARGLPLQPTEVELAERSEEEDRRLEKEIQAEVMDLLRAYGFTVFNLSQPRATKQTPGIGDVYAVNPWRRRVLWFETKTPDGRQSPDQVEFQVLHVQLESSTITYVPGGVLAAEEYLIAIGAAERTSTGGIEPTLRRS